VVLVHDWPCAHWDFLVEAGPVLRAWRLPELPAVGARVRAEPNADHRLLYLDYEGPVSGNRGTVTRYDAGTCDWLEDGPERVRVELRGARFVGIAELVRGESGWTFALSGG
jgi:DNA polymerase Ligase (LigD)